MAKEMVLVPKSDILGQRVLSETLDPVLNKRLTLDEEIENVLHNKTLSMEDKKNRYLIALNPYLKMKKKMDMNDRRDTKYSSETDIKPHMENVSTQTEEEKTKDKTFKESTIINYINGKVQKRRAEKIIDFLQSNGDLSWADNGNVVLSGNVIKNSNIIDVLSDLVNSTSATRRRNKSPVGLQATLNHFKQINMPESFIGNKSLLSSTPVSKRTRHQTIVKRLKKPPNMKKKTEELNKILKWSKF